MHLPIKVQRLYITEFDMSMAETVHLNSLDDDNRRFVPDEVFETVDKAKEILNWLISCYAKKDAPLVYPILLNDGQNIGYVQAVPIPDGWEIGYHVAKSATGNGYATEAVCAFLYPIMNKLGIKHIYGICRADNAASRRVFEKCGFELVFDGIGSYHGEQHRICRYKFTKNEEPKMDIRIETSRLILRPFIESNAAAASYNSRQPSVSHYMPEMVKETEEVALGWIRFVNKELFDIGKPCVLFAIVRKTDERCMGCIFINRKEEWGNIVEMGYYVADEYQNNGYATEAGKAIIWWAFEKAGQDVLSAFVKPENTASRRVIEKLGFICGGTRTLPHNGEDCAFDYFRLYHTDYLPSPEWDARNPYKAEPMGAFFDTRADGYNNVMFASSGGEEDYKRLVACFPETDEAVQILDIGCGTGIELDYIWKQMPNTHITCVDVSRGMLDLLLKNHPGSHDRITVIEASYIDWPYPENAFEIVVSNMTMHHLWPEEKTEVYRKILSTLKLGGIYIEGDFIVKDDLMAEQYKRRYEIITTNLPDKAKAGEYHIDIPCTLETQKKLLQDAEFSSVEVLDDNINRGNGAILKAKK